MQAIKDRARYLWIAALVAIAALLRPQFAFAAVDGGDDDKVTIDLMFVLIILAIILAIVLIFYFWRRPFRRPR